MKSMEQKCSSGLRNRFDRRMQMRANTLARPFLPTLSNLLQRIDPPLFHSLRLTRFVKKPIFLTDSISSSLSLSREGATIVSNNSLFAEKIVYGFDEAESRADRRGVTQRRRDSVGSSRAAWPTTAIMQMNVN